MTKRVQIIATILLGSAIALGIAILSIITYSTYQAYQFDYANHKAMVQIIQYNLQQGRLLAVPSPPVATPTVTAPPAASTAEPPKEGKK